jgi:aromatic ring-opening dioxygenase catalytic subunit (LigB family)
MTDQAKILYIPHGGGPLPLLGHEGHSHLVHFLSSISLAEPEAVVVISAHWERDIPVITSGRTPKLIYDYFGFPQEAYELTYPAKGHPDLAHEIVNIFSTAGIKARADENRGFDHGLFIPLSLLRPHADLPCIQISLTADLDPQAHLKMGEALAPLANRNLWILGSGFSFHNMAFFRTPLPKQGDEENQAFQDWLLETCTDSVLLPEERRERLLRWEFAPHARFCHPREEHLLPLMVCAGMAGYTRAQSIFDSPVMGKRALAFSWEVCS